MMRHSWYPAWRATLDPLRTFVYVESNASPCADGDLRPGPENLSEQAVSSHSIERQVFSIRFAGNCPSCALRALKSDRLGKRLCCAILRRLPPSFVLSVSSCNDGGRVGKPLLDLDQKLLPALYSGHVDLGEDRDYRARFHFAGRSNTSGGRTTAETGWRHRAAIHNQNADTHDAPCCCRLARARQSGGELGEFSDLAIDGDRAPCSWLTMS